MVNCHSFICVKAQPLYHVSADNIAGPVDPMCTVYPNYLVFILAFLKEAFQSIKKPEIHTKISKHKGQCQQRLNLLATQLNFEERI